MAVSVLVCFHRFCGNMPVSSRSPFKTVLTLDCFCVMQYFSNSALANTSVSSTTVLTSTSGLFTLLFGAFLRQDSINVPKVVAVSISIAGVAMTTIGKTWASDELLSITE